MIGNRDSVVSCVCALLWASELQGVKRCPTAGQIAQRKPEAPDRHGPPPLSPSLAFGSLPSVLGVLSTLPQCHQSTFRRAVLRIRPPLYCPETHTASLAYLASQCVSPAQTKDKARLGPVSSHVARSCLLRTRLAPPLDPTLPAYYLGTGGTCALAPTKPGTGIALCRTCKAMRCSGHGP
jgi:hypothetical protein